MVSFSGYSSGSRDSTRAEDLANISKALAVSSTVTGKLPTPDNGVIVSSNGTPIRTQGYAGKSTLSTIKFNGAGLDPLDGKPYTYTIDSLAQQFALMGYYETQSNLTSLAPFSSSYAATTDYSTRYVGISGNPVGVIVSSGSQQPLQASGLSSLDITTAPTNTYVAYLSSKNTLTGSLNGLPSNTCGLKNQAWNGTSCVAKVGNTVYVSNNGSNTVSVINGTSGVVMATIPVGTGPGGIDVNPNTNMVYVANYNSSNVTVINGMTNAVVTMIPVGVNPQTLTVNPNTNMIYVANYTGGSVSVINGATNTVVANITVPNAQGVDVNASTNTIYVGSANTNSLYVINGNTNTVTTSFTLGAGTFPESVIVNPTTNTVYVGNYS